MNVIRMITRRRSLPLLVAIASPWVCISFELPGADRVVSSALNAILDGVFDYG